MVGASCGMVNAESSGREVSRRRMLQGRRAHAVPIRWPLPGIRGHASFILA